MTNHLHDQPPLLTQTSVYARSHAGMHSTLAGFTVIHQSISSVTGALDQSSDHLTLLGAAPIILVTVALARARACVQNKTHHRLIQRQEKHTVYRESDSSGLEP